MSHAVSHYPEPWDDVTVSEPNVVPTEVQDTGGSLRLEWPIMVGAIILFIPIAIGFVRTVFLPQPQNPWESASVAEAWRSLNGMPVYEPPGIGHATLMYGPLWPWLLGMAFRVTGPETWTGRAIQLACALVLVAVLVVVCMRSRRLSPSLALATVALFVGLDTPSGHYFVQNRPDMTALMFGGLGAVGLWIGYERRRVGVYLLAIACVLVGMLFKQTAMMVCAIPAIPILFDRRASLTRRVVYAAAPLALAVALLVTIKLAAPVVYHYMVTVPKQYRISPSGIVTAMWLLGTAIPLFTVCFVAWLSRFRFEIDRVLLWVLSAMAVTIPASVLSYGKDGGAPNSLLPGLISMALFTALYLPQLLESVRRSSQRLALRVPFTAAIAALLAFGVLPGVLTAARSDPFADYSQLIHDVARLGPGRVVAPEDPLIPFAARGTLDRNVYLEYDAFRWPKEIPDYMQDEIRAADYVVDVTDWWQNVINAGPLTKLGFVQMRTYPHYSLWRKRVPGDSVSLVPVAQATATPR